MLANYVGGFLNSWYKKKGIIAEKTYKNKFFSLINNNLTIKYNKKAKKRILERRA